MPDVLGARMREDTSPLDPRRGALHAILRRHLRRFLAEREEAGSPLPRFVVRELDGYLECGVLACGCALYECPGCSLVRVTALSCKGRGFCPRCGGRRMSEGARDLVTRVLPHVRIRHWVLSLPFDLRVRLAFHHDEALALWRIAERAIDPRYRRLAREHGLLAPRGGSVLVIHRAGSDLRLNLHFHSLFPDGAFAKDGTFFTAPAPSPDDVEAILHRIITRAGRRFSIEPRELGDDEQALARTYAASLHGERHRPEHDDDTHDFGVLPSSRRKARIDAGDLDAEVAVDEHDRARLEHLARYLLRPPLALDRLSLLGDDYVCLALKKPWADRTTHVTMSASAFLGRLASLVPRPRANTTVYFGVLAANAKHRDAIVPRGEDTAKRARPDSSWAALMRHSFGIDVLACPRCGDRLAFSAVLIDRREVRRLLEHLSIFPIVPAIPPARGPPDHHDSLCFG